MSSKEIVITAASRTAIGTFGGSLKDTPPTALAAAVVKDVVEKSNIPADQVGHVVFGNVLHSDRRDIYMARVAAVDAGLHHQTPALTVNRLCGSGLQSLVSATQLIQSGDCDIAISGGAESMSRVPYWLPSARFGARMGDAAMVDAMTSALTCPFENIHMGITAENIAEKWGISREEQDELALESHKRAQKAIESGVFKDQIVPIEVRKRRDIVQFDTDEHVRLDASEADFAKLKPVFKKDGSVTAGNASGLNDAAAALAVMTAEKAKELGATPLVKVVDYSFAGVEPKYMGIGPVPAVNKLLEKTGLKVEDIDLWEVNEAFAAQALAVVKDLNLPMDKVNPNGSGISLGHPIGATGALITVKAVHELKRINGKYAVITMCIGGGQGIAALIENIA